MDGIVKHRVRNLSIVITFTMVLGKGLNNNNNMLYSKIDPDLNAVHVVLYIN